jgi:hypothetical protein
MSLDFVGMSDTSPHGNCPAVHVERESGDGIFVGKVVTDPETIAQVTRHADIDLDEGVFRIPASMWPVIAKAAAGDYEPGLQGHGPLGVEDMIAVIRRSAAHLEMQPHYGLDDPSFLAWKATGRHPADDERDEAWRHSVRTAVARGVTFRRLRIVPEPLTDYLEWERAITTEVNVAAGEQVRWLPRSQVVGLLVPAHDFWLFDTATVRFAHFDLDGRLTSEQSTGDQAVVAQNLAAFEVLWDRAIPHADFRP